MAAMLPFAAQPDIVCAMQKDTLYLYMIKAALSECTMRLAGNRVQLRFDEELGLLSRLLYYSLTTLIGQQTLGEEYCDIIQVSHSMKPLQLWQRAALVTLHTLFPFVYQRVIKQMVARAANDENKSKWTSLFRDIFQHAIAPAHLVLFYFTGAYYDLSKRLTNTRYVFARQLRPGETRPSYELLGILLAIQLVFQAYSWWQQQQRRKEYEENESVTEVSTAGVEEEEISGPSCMLCMNSCDQPTAAPCGHLFCWQCICKWANEKPECPFCRRSLALQQLIPVYHYE